jgi:glycosyltransferase involved in cell wall biosynthesis
MPSRSLSLDRLVHFINKHKTELTEVLINSDNGTKSVGVKRQELLEEAKGEYVAYIDDDDKISAEYFKLVLSGCSTEPDCCSLLGLYYVNGVYNTKFEHSVNYRVWEQRANGLYARPPNHLNAIRRKVALQIGFADMRCGEDQDFSERLCASGLIRSEYRIKAPIYKYLYSEVK